MRIRRSTALGAALFLLAGCTDDPLPVYDEAEIAYFVEITFGSEYGAPADTFWIRKWTQPVRIAVVGFPTERHIAVVRDVADELDRLTAGIDVRSLGRDPDRATNVQIAFVTHDAMVAEAGSFAQDNAGFFRYWRGDDDAIDSARAWIAYDRGNPDLHDHMIREELTQLLGLGQDSWTYEESIFYQGPSDVTEFAPIDRSVIRMLYDRRIEPGMLREEAIAILAGE